ncbi:hypothetical protein CGCVW01_v009351 [Colletotrichum viniferum]|nr:hypothetical protein CGCVW01_v009351 [Colletotrichum viniferum]
MGRTDRSKTSDSSSSKTQTPQKNERSLPTASSPTESPQIPDNSPTFLPHAIKRFVSPAHKNNLESAELKVKKTRQDFDTIVKKRNFSELSAASITSEHDDKRIRGETSEEVFEAFLKAKEAELQAAKEKRAILEKMWEDGDISDRNEFHNALDICQQQINHNLMRVATLRSSRHQLIGQLTDEALFPEQVERERKLDWAYIDGLLWKYHAPYGATATIKSEVTEDQRARFRKAVITAQGSTAADGYQLWCPVSRQFWPPSSLKASHVVKANVGEVASEAIFDRRPGGHIWNASNGIMMLAEYEEAFDNARIAIVPSRINAADLEVIILDDDLRKEDPRGKIIWGQSLDGTQLKFLKGNGPSRRYLYYKFLMSILRRQRGNVPGSSGDRSRIHDAAKALWAGPGRYLKHSTLFKLSRQVGFLTEEEARRFWDLKHDPDPLSTFAEDLSTTMAFRCEAGLIPDDEEGGAEDHLVQKAKGKGKQK